jgi:hypothetical protein
MHLLGFKHKANVFATKHDGVLCWPIQLGAKKKSHEAVSQFGGKWVVMSALFGHLDPSFNDPNR